MAGNTLAALAALFGSMARTAPAAQRRGLASAGRILRDEARGDFGSYQPGAGPFQRWADLADATIRDRVSKGYTANDPLLRSGELRSTVFYDVDGNEVHVFSNDQRAPWHEFGTKRMPPRAFLGPAVVKRGDDALEAVAKAVLPGWG